jgi:hypothetical protein
MRIIVTRISILDFWGVRMEFLIVDYWNGKFGVYNTKNNEE